MYSENLVIVVVLLHRVRHAARGRVAELAEDLDGVDPRRVLATLIRRHEDLQALDALRAVSAMCDRALRA